MQSQPLISIIIPTKNRASLVIETIESVRNQTYPYWEAVVVDDLSDDNTWAVLEDLAAHDSRIRPVLRAGQVGGSAVARNQGIDASRGSFVLFLDSDDLLAFTALEGRLKRFAERPEADAVVGDCEYFRKIPGEYHDECAIASDLGKEDDPLEAFLTRCSPWITSGPLWRREAIKRTGPWKTSTSDDNQYHTRALLSAVKFLRLSHADWYWRLHCGDHVSGPAHFNASKQIELLDNTTQLLQSHGLLTRRKKRMLAWSCLLSALTCAVEHSAVNVREANVTWLTARTRGLAGASFYFLGAALIRLQWSKALGLAPRELARFIVYLDLKHKPPVSKGLLLAALGYMKYLIIHFGHWNRARIRRP
jgi:glycosyltransferase involved in cell wall biosynthesis